MAYGFNDDKSKASFEWTLAGTASGTNPVYYPEEARELLIEINANYSVLSGVPRYIIKARQDNYGSNNIFLPFLDVYGSEIGNPFNKITIGNLTFQYNRSTSGRYIKFVRANGFDGQVLPTLSLSKWEPTINEFRVYWR